MIELLEGTSIADTLANLRDYFGSVQSEVDSFVSNTCISCPGGCGTCCERFMPDITEAEAMMVAAEILMKDNQMELRRRLEKAKGHTVGPCPLYDFNNDHHCMVYEARPLICRLFGNCCFPNKKGEATFRACHLNPGFKAVDEETLRTYEGRVPVMGEYGIGMRAIEGNGDATEFLPEAILKSIAMIEYYLSMLFPAPKAS